MTYIMDPKAIHIFLKKHCYSDSWSKTLSKLDFKTHLFHGLQTASWLSTGSDI